MSILLINDKYKYIIVTYRKSGCSTARLLHLYLTYPEKKNIPNFEDMYQGQYDSGAEFAEQIASDCGYISRDMPSWIEIDWQKTWDNALSYDYTQIGYAIFNDSY